MKNLLSAVFLCIISISIQASDPTTFEGDVYLRSDQGMLVNIKDLKRVGDKYVSTRAYQECTSYSDENGQEAEPVCVKYKKFFPIVSIDRFKEVCEVRESEESDNCVLSKKVAYKVPSEFNIPIYREEGDSRIQVGEVKYRIP